MPGIVMNVGPSMAGSTGGSSGGQTLGAAQGTITINVRNVTQANSILQNSAKAMSESFKLAGKEARANSQIQIAAAKTASAQAQAAAKINIANSGAVVAANQNAAKSIISGHRVQQSSFKTMAAQTTAAAQQIIAGHKVTTASAQAAAAQQKQAHQAVIQPLQQVALQTRITAAQQRTAHNTVMQPLQQQIAANRLVISGLNLQAAQARATARAQQQAALAAQSSWQKFNTQLGDIRGELIGLGVASGLVAASGLQYAGTLQEARIQLEAMTGSQEAANDLMDNLAEKGKNAGIPLRQMLTFATQLLPTLHGETQELEKWFDIVRRTATLNRGPTGGVQGATFSLREAFLSFQAGGRDFVSIADRFNISKVSLAEALENALGDTQEEKFLNALDSVLTDMGITTEMADRMGKTFNASFELARDGALRLLAEGFGPLLEVLGPVLQGLADLLNMISDTAPEIALAGSALLTIVAVGSPLLLFVNQLTLAWTSMGLAAQTAILRVGRLAAIGGGAAVGVAVGRELGFRAGNLARRATGQEELSREDVNQRMANYFFMRWVEIVKAGDDIRRALVSVQVSILEGMAAIRRGVMKIYQDLEEGTNIPFLSQYFGDEAKREGEEAFRYEAEAARLSRERDARTAAMWNNVLDVGERLKITGFDRPRPRGAASDDGLGFSQDAIEEMVDHYKALRDITRNAGREIAEETQQWESERSRTIAQYEKDLAREARDYGRQRVEQERQFQQTILDMADDAAYNRQRQIEEFEDSLRDRRRDMAEEEEEIREDSAKRVLDLEEEYAEEREKALRNHRNRILEAASNLDADAIRKEQLRFSEQQTDADEAHQKALKQEQENVEERLEDQDKAFRKFERQQRESLDERFEQQREDDERQLARMKRDFEDQKKQQDDERAIRLNDLHEDHLDQLAEMDNQHLLRIQQIQTQAQEERDAQWEEHQENMAQIGIMTAAWETEQKQLVASAIAVHRQFWEAQNRMFHTTAPQFPSLQDPYALLNRTNAPVQGPMTKSEGLKIESILIQIIGSTNMGPAELDRVVKSAITKVFEDFTP